LIKQLSSYSTTNPSLVAWLILLLRCSFFLLKSVLRSHLGTHTCLVARVRDCPGYRYVAFIIRMA